MRTLGIRLLADLRTVFGDADAMPTVAVLQALNDLEDAPWSEIKGGKPLDDKGLAARLRKYDIKSTSVRIGPKTPKGYKREDLHDAWERYLPPLSLPIRAATSATPETQNGNGATATPAMDACVRCDGEGCAWCSREPL